MEKRITKKDYFNMLEKVVERAEVENKEDLLVFIERQKELLSQKTSRKTKAQIENEAIIEEIYSALKRMEKPVTVSELQKEDVEMAKYTNQKLTALLKKLEVAGRIVKTIEKKKSYFSVCAE